MKKIILKLAVALFLPVTMLTSCQSAATKAENSGDKVQDARENVAEARQELNQALIDSVMLFRKISDEKISRNEKTIAEFRVKLAKERKENRVRYEKNLAVLEQKNLDLKKKLSDYKEERNQDWNEFRTEFNHDMDELGKAFDDLTVNNVK